LKILVINSECPFPLNAGGRVSLFYRLQELKRNGVEVCLAYPMIGSNALSLSHPVRSVCTEVHEFSIGYFQSLLQMLAFFWLPFRSARRYSKPMKRFVKSRARDFDAIVVEHSSMAIYTRSASDLPPTVLVFHSLNYKSLRRIVHFMPWQKILKKIVYAIEVFKTWMYEISALKSDKYCEFWFFSQDDLEEVSAMNYFEPEKCRLIPLTLPDILHNIARDNNTLSDKRLAKILSARKGVVLVGSMDNPSNEDAARWFCNEIMPLVWQRSPKTSVEIIGKSSLERLADLQNQNVVVVGEVEVLDEYLTRAKVCVVPQRGGAGVRVKFLVGLSAGAPVVSTTVGVEGMEGIEPNVHFLHADTAEAFAESILRLISDPHLAARIGDAGHEFFKQNYSFGATGKFMIYSLAKQINESSR
jgi:glycosyltransferase involved in cell wall biosynthesis